MRSLTTDSRPLRHCCRNCRRPFEPTRRTHAFCRAACRKAAHRLRAAEPPDESPASALLTELRDLQAAAGLPPSAEQPYLALFAQVKNTEREMQLLAKRLAQLRRELAALPEPAFKVRIYQLPSAIGALPQVNLDSRWVGAFASGHGATLVLGNNEVG